MVDVRQDEEPVNLYLKRGDYFPFRLRVASDVEGEFIDFTDYTFLAQIRQTADSDTVLATIDVTRFDNGADDRGLDFVITDTVSKDLPTGRVTKTPKPVAVWDCEITDPDGHPRTWFAGDVYVSKDVSRAVTP